MDNKELLNYILIGGFVLFALIYLYITLGKQTFAKLMRLFGIRKPKGPRVKKWLKLKGALYFVVMAILLSLIGGFAYFFTFPYFLCAFSMLLLGLVHNFILYSDFLGWTKRSQEHIDDDSFGREFAYTFFIALVGAIGFMKFYTYFEDLPTWRISSLTMCFLLPFIILKAKDFAHQIAPHDFEIKWKYPISEIDPNRMYREGGKFVRLEFYFTFNLVDGTEEGIWVKAPLDESLATAFKIAIFLFNNEKELHQQADNLGYHEKKNWWLLFYKKSFIFKTYLDPNDDVEKFIERRVLDERDKIYVERQFS